MRDFTTQPNSDQQTENTRNTQTLNHDPIGNEKYLEKLKRPYTVEDIVNFQQELTEFETQRKKEGAIYVFDKNSFYRFLISPKKKTRENEATNKSEIPTRDYQELELGIFNGWRQKLLANQDKILKLRPKLAEVVEILQKETPPKNLDELRNLYRRFPLINDMSSVSYQEGVGDENTVKNGFLHFKMARFHAYEYQMPKTEMRIYLNPPIEAIPKLSIQLINLTERERIPLYFKIIDYSFQKFTPENANRIDKMLIYTDRENLPKLAKVIKELQSDHPEWFRGRELPTLVAPILDGVGIAAEPNNTQEQKFGNWGRSFNALRAIFLREVWKDTTKDILLQNRDLRPRRGRTFQQIFNDQFKFSTKNFELNGQTTEQLIEKLWRSGLDAKKVDPENKTMLADYLEHALLRTMQDVVPNITADSMVSWVNNRIQEKAPEFGINPENLALNK